MASVTTATMVNMGDFASRRRTCLSPITSIRRGGGGSSQVFLPAYNLPMLYSRRDWGRMAAASVPLAGLFAATRINSKFDGVQIGAITYSFNRIASEPEAIVKAFVEVGLGEAELMSNHCEALAGAPIAAGGGQAQREQTRQWRASTSAHTWKAVRQKFNDAGIEVALLCYNMNDNMKDEDIEYGFAMAQGSASRPSAPAPLSPWLSGSRPSPTAISCWSVITATTPPATPIRRLRSKATPR